MHAAHWPPPVSTVAVFNSPAKTHHETSMKRNTGWVFARLRWPSSRWRILIQETNPRTICRVIVKKLKKRRRQSEWNTSLHVFVFTIAGAGCSYDLAKCFFRVCIASVWTLEGSLELLALVQWAQLTAAVSKTAIFLLYFHCKLFWTFGQSCTENKNVFVFSFVQEKESFYMNNRSTDNSSDMSNCNFVLILRLRFFGQVPSDAFRATHPFSPVPMLVCHGCQVSAAFLPPSLCTVCPLCDGTRCPCCYYPRTLPGRARGRFPPIIVISNGQPRGRGSERERET